MATSHHNNDKDKMYFKQGSCTIILKQGNLLDEKDVDAIVIPTPPSNEPKAESFAIFRDFYSNADADNQRDIDKIRRNIAPTDPQVRSKQGHGYIFMMPPYIGNPDRACDFLKKAYSSCLKVAVKNNFQKIAFPTIGCGVIGFSTNDVARCVHQSLTHFGQSKDGKQINEIRIVVFDERIWPEFTSVFMDMSDDRNSKIRFDRISSPTSNKSDIPSEKDKKQPSQTPSRTDESKEYPNDFDDDEEDKRRGDVKRHTSNLNPNSSEFRPNKNNFPRRVLRRYRLKNSQTELIIVQGDILTTKVDAIVNAANEMMLGGGGVDGVIHRAAGDKLRKACEAHKQVYHGVRLPIGRSRILLSYDMSKTTHYIINTSGPRYDDAPPNQCRTHLTSCYKTSLALANLYDLETIAYTAISCGIFGYPVDEGAEVALKTVDAEADAMREIWFVLKDDHIYDAWVKKAKELHFIALDNVDDEPSSIRTQSPTNKPKTTEVTSSTREGVKLSVIDASTSDKADDTDRIERDRSSQKPSTTPPEKHDSKHAVGNEDNPDASDTSQGANSKKSGGKENDASNKGQASNNSSKQGPDGHKASPSSGPQQRAKNSTTQRGGGGDNKKR